jgi:DNA-binding transcriptional MerR regulator
MTKKYDRTIRQLFYLFIFVSGLSLLPSGAHAQKVRALSEQNVTDFINQTTDITSGRQTGMSMDEIKQYLDKHLEKKSRFRSTIRYNVPGYPSQQGAISLQKEDFIDSVEKGAKTMQNYDTTVEIKSIQISRDKTKATVQTVSTEKGTMPMPAENGQTEDVPMEGSSTCNQVIMLSDGVIQMYSAQCVTDISFLPY